MMHYLKSENGDFKLNIRMVCNHPDMQGNTTDSVGCDGNCSDCCYSIASCTIPEMMELLERANCNHRR